MKRLLVVAVSAGAALATLTACGDAAASGSGSKVALTAGDTSCQLASTTMAAGPVTFAVTNSGSSTTEVYVYGQEGSAYTKIVGEVENIGPGTSRDLSATLAGGSYEVACKPGQKGDGIRTRITVTGAAAAGSASASSSPGYDREFELATDGTTITGVPVTAKAGERVEFALRNNAKAARNFEVKDPTGAVRGEAKDVAPGAEGPLVIALDKPGTWTLIVEGAGVADVTAALTVA